MNMSGLMPMYGVFGGTRPAPPPPPPSAKDTGEELQTARNLLTALDTGESAALTSDEIADSALSNLADQRIWGEIEAEGDADLTAPGSDGVAAGPERTGGAGMGPPPPSQAESILQGLIAMPGAEASSGTAATNQATALYTAMQHVLT